jgi:hypothetical protein
VLVTWVGAVPDDSRPTHRHVFVCAACVVLFDQPKPEPEPDPEPVSVPPMPIAAPPPLVIRTERWLRIANTALSCVAAVVAAAALRIAWGELTSTAYPRMRKIPMSSPYAPWDVVWFNDASTPTHPWNSPLSSTTWIIGLTWELPV